MPFLFVYSPALIMRGTPATTTLTYLTNQHAADGSWGSDPYLTARVLEAFAANKPNLVIGASDVIVNPATVIDGANVTVSVKVTNIGALLSPSSSVVLHLTDVNGRTAYQQCLAEPPCF